MQQANKKPKPNTDNIPARKEKKTEKAWRANI
jgi:hypothetical protein